MAIPVWLAIRGCTMLRSRNSSVLSDRADCLVLKSWMLVAVRVDSST
jgi:hypothetical protein